MSKRKLRKNRGKPGKAGAVAPTQRGGTQKSIPLGDLDGFAASRLDWEEVRALFKTLASSSLGRRAIMELEPREDDAARAALTRCRELLAADLSAPPLLDLGDPLPTIEAAVAERRALSAAELAGLLDFMRAVVRITAWLAQHAESLPENAALVRDLPSLEGLRSSLEAGIDPRGEVRDSASSRLSRLRADVRQLTQQMEKKAKAIANRPELKNAIADGQMGRVHLRDGRPVLAIKTKSAGRLRGLVHDRSASGETTFIEPAELIELGNQLATKRADEAREVLRLLLEWTREVLERRAGIESTSSRLAEFELAVTSERFARRFDAVPAQVADDGVLVLRGARHPLLAAQVLEGQLDKAVPLDLRLGEPFDQLVITGPNTGGKTLALKTAGLAGLMTRMGLPIPAERGTQVPLYRGIVADIGDEQEVQQSLSTFSSHLARIAEGLPRASPRTLFLLDELGGGTDPADGAALGAALLEWLLARHAPTLASTHIGKLKEFAFSHPRVENASVEFDVETLAPLYRLIVGTPGESRALSIAKGLGFESAILTRAEELVERTGSRSEELMGDIQTARVAAERSRSRADERLDEIESVKSEVETLRADMARREELLATEAQAELERRLLEARGLNERAEKLCAQLPADAQRDLRDVLAQLSAALGAASLTEARADFIDKLRKGDFVYVPRYKKRCLVLKVEREKGRVKLRLGKQEMQVALDEVSALESL